MNNAFDELRSALSVADQADKAVEHYAGRMAELLNRHRGAPLRRVSAYELKRLKKALRDFDMVTGKWKS